MAYHCDKRGRGDKPYGQLHNSHPATSPLQRDWTRVGWHRLPFPLINSPSLGGAEGRKKDERKKNRQKKKMKEKEET
jgi:hypothetical protein